MTEVDDDKGSANVPTNLRLLMILEEVAKLGVPITPTEANQKIGLPKQTIHRLFATLESEGFLQRDIDGRYYTAGRRLRRMSTNVLSSLRVRTARLTVLNALASSIGETCNISVPDRHAMTYLDRVETKWPLRIQLQIGTEVPFYCTASGKMYLSSLRRSHFERYLAAATFEQVTSRTITDRDALRSEIEATRKRGFAEDNEEFMDGMIALAVPILDDQKRLLATLSFHGPTQRLSIGQAHNHLPKLKAASKELARLVTEDL